MESNAEKIISEKIKETLNKIADLCMVALTALTTAIAMEMKKGRSPVGKFL